MRWIYGNLCANRAERPTKYINRLLFSENRNMIIKESSNNQSCPANSLISLFITIVHSFQNPNTQFGHDISQPKEEKKKKKYKLLPKPRWANNWTDIIAHWTFLCYFLTWGWANYKNLFSSLPKPIELSLISILSLIS